MSATTEIQGDTELFPAHSPRSRVYGYNVILSLNRETVKNK